MSIVANVGNYYSIDIINIGGEFMTILLIISIVATLLLMNTKFWNKLVESTLTMVVTCLLLVFVLTLISNLAFRL